MVPQLLVLATVLVSSSSFKRFTNRLTTMNKLLSVRIVRAAKGSVGVLALLAGLSMPALAETYPGRPVTLVVPFPPVALPIRLDAPWPNRWGNSSDNRL